MLSLEPLKNNLLNEPQENCLTYFWIKGRTTRGGRRILDYLGGPSWCNNREAKERGSRQAHLGLVALEVRLPRARPAVDGRPAGSASALWVASSGTCVP